MTGRLAARLGLGGLGVLVAAYGAHLLLARQDPADHPATAAWLVAGVLLHDAVLAPVLVGSAVLGARLVPRPARAPVVVGVVVLGAVTLVGIPVLGRFGARPDNPTLLDRAYGPGWVVLAGLVALGVALATALRARAARRAAGSGRHAGPPA